MTIDHRHRNFDRLFHLLRQHRHHLLFLFLRRCLPHSRPLQHGVKHDSALCRVFSEIAISISTSATSPLCLRTSLMMCSGFGYCRICLLMVGIVQ